MKANEQVSAAVNIPDRIKSRSGRRRTARSCFAVPFIDQNYRLFPAGRDPPDIASLCVDRIQALLSDRIAHILYENTTTPYRTQPAIGS